MKRNFLTTEEFVAFRIWIAENGFRWEENTNTINLFDVNDGRFNFYVAPTLNPELFEVLDDSDRETVSILLEDFYKHKSYLRGVEVPKKKIEKFIPNYLKPYADNFDHFRIVQRQDKLWDLMGAVGYYMERIAICDYKLPLKTLGANFQETYWTLVFTAKKEKRVVLYADNKKLDGDA